MSCRHASRNANVPLKAVSAGENMQLNWNFGAAHVGDCTVFLSYDVDKPRAEQRFIKIANLPKCKDQNKQDVDIKLPAWLPADRLTVKTRAPPRLHLHADRPNHRCSRAWSPTSSPASSATT